MKLLKAKNIKNYIILILTFIIIYLIKSPLVIANEVVSKVDFDTTVAAGGDYVTIMDTSRRLEVDFLKVELKAKDGDKYDVRFKYSDNLLKTNKTIAVKKGLEANNKKTEIYFIPKKGKCPGKKSQCVKIPVIEGISTEDKLIDSDEVIYGIEIYNGSAFGWLMDVKGKFTFVSYEK